MRRGEGARGGGRGGGGCPAAERVAAGTRRDGLGRAGRGPLPGGGGGGPGALAGRRAARAAGLARGERGSPGSG